MKISNVHITNLKKKRLFRAQTKFVIQRTNIDLFFIHKTFIIETVSDGL